MVMYETLETCIEKMPSSTTNKESKCVSNRFEESNKEYDYFSLFKRMAVFINNGVQFFLLRICLFKFNVNSEEIFIILFKKVNHIINTS